MNLEFGSEVALLGFWEYMFRILLRVCKTPQYGMSLFHYMFNKSHRCVKTLFRRDGTSGFENYTLLECRLKNR